MVRRKVLVLGATGLVGNAAIKQFSQEEECSVVAVSRRRPDNLYGADFISVDLRNQEDCNQVFGSMRDITHVVYAALYEKPNLISGWVDQEQIEVNDQMIRNCLEPLERASSNLQHITLLQGTKAYGGHVRPAKIPSREGVSDARDVPNFYWEQEGYIKKKQEGKDWGWTILRPQLIIGESIGSPMNLIPVIGAYGAILKEQGKPLYFPGKETAITEAVDADLLANAISWAGKTNSAHNETFNVTNGDVFVWKNVWPAIAEALGMEAADADPISLTNEMPKYEREWDEIREKYQLLSPKLIEFIGSSSEFADLYLSDLETPSIVSTIKIRQAGFTKSIDTEVMFRRWIKHFQDKRLLPPI